MSIENYFDSIEFMNALLPLYGKVKEENISRVIQFIISRTINFVSSNNFSMDGADEYVRKLVLEISKNPNGDFLSANSPLTKFEDDLCFEMILKHLGYTKDDLEDNSIERKVSRYLIENLRINGYMYHSFNSVFYESILEHGINPNIKFTSQDELDKIHNIFKKYGLDMALGWQKLNCVDMVSYACSPDVCYSYAMASPEWFSQFCSGGFMFCDIDNRVQHAFRDNDYDGAKNNLLSLMKRKKFSSEDMIDVIGFFDDNWKKYANHEAMLAIVPKKEKNTDVDTLYRRFCDLGCSVKDLYNICSCGRNVDEHTDEVIDISKVRFIKMPNYSKFAKKLSSDDILSKLKILKDSRIYFKNDAAGNKVFASANGEEEVKLVKSILCDNSVLNYILDNKTEFDGWIPYFSYSLLNRDENVVKLAQKKWIYFPYVSEEQRNNVDLMIKCVSGSNVYKDIIYLVGSDVLNNMEFVTRLLIKLPDNDFDFVSGGADSIDGSRMAYGKLFGKNVQTSPNFWKLLNSKIRLMNKKYKLDMPLFDENREIVIASRYFDEKKAQKN